MTDYDGTQESLGVASGHQVLEAFEEALGVNDRVGLVSYRHSSAIGCFKYRLSGRGRRWLVEAADNGEIFGIDFD